jgi:sodium/potassium-transporting ATPase subunit alpha
LTRDIETQEVIKPSPLQAIVTKIKAPFSRDFWEKHFEATEDETLVDSKLLSYAYLEAGLIETLGA